MKKIAQYLLVASLTVLLLQSCKKDDNNAGCTDGSINFPHLADGHKIDYYFTSLFYDDDTISYSLSSTSDPSTYQVSTTSRNGSAQPYVAALSSVYWHACGRDLYTSTNNDYNQLGHWWVSLDANVGDTWTRKDGSKTYNYKLVGKNVTVVTYNLGQTFTDCYKLTYNQAGTFNVDTFYFKPEIGVVDYEGFAASYEVIGKNF